MKEEPNKSELEVINRMMDQLESELKKKRDQKTLNDPEMFLTYMNRAAEAYALIAEELGNCLYVIGMQNHFTTTRKLFRLCQQQVNSILKFSLRYFVRKSEEIENNQKFNTDQYSFYANLKAQEMKSQIAEHNGAQGQDGRGGQYADKTQILQYAQSPPTKKLDSDRRSSPRNPMKSSAQHKKSPLRTNTKIDTSNIPTSTTEPRSERQAPPNSSKGIHNKPSTFKFRENYESSHYNPTHGTDDDEEEEKDQIEYEKMKKEIDQFLKKKSTLDSTQSAGTANELKQVLRQLEITRKKARGIAEEEDEDKDLHGGIDIGEITDGALGAFAMAQKKTAKKVIRHITQEQKIEEIIQTRNRSEAGVNTDEVMSNILRQMYQSELDPAFDKLRKEIGHLETRIKNREEEIAKLEKKLMDAIREHHGCGDEKNELEFKINSLREDNEKLIQNVNACTALLKELGAKEPKLQELTNSGLSVKDERSKEEILSYQRRLKKQEAQIEELQKKIDELIAQQNAREEEFSVEQHEDDAEIEYVDEEDENQNQSTFSHDLKYTESTPKNHTPSPIHSKAGKSRVSDQPSRNANISPFGKAAEQEVIEEELPTDRQKNEKPSRKNSDYKTEKKEKQPEKSQLKPADKKPAADTSGPKTHSNKPSAANNSIQQSSGNSDGRASQKPSESVQLRSPGSQISISDQNKTPLQETPTPSIHPSQNQTPADTPNKKKREIKMENGEKVQIITTNKKMLTPTPVNDQPKSEVETPTTQNKPESAAKHEIRKSVDNSPYLPVPKGRASEKAGNTQKVDNRAERPSEKSVNSAKPERVSERSQKEDPKVDKTPQKLDKSPRNDRNEINNKTDPPQSSSQKPQPAAPKKSENIPTFSKKTQQPSPEVRLEDPAPAQQQASTKEKIARQITKQASIAANEAESKASIENETSGEKVRVIEKKVIVKKVEKKVIREDAPEAASKVSLDPEMPTPRVQAKKKIRMQNKGVQTDVIASERSTPQLKKRLENPDANKVVVPLQGGRIKDYGKTYHFPEFDSDDKDDEIPSISMSKGKHTKLNSTYASPKEAIILEERYEDTPKKLIKSTTNMKIPKRTEFRSIPKLKQEPDSPNPEDYIFNDPQTTKMTKTTSHSIFQSKNFSKTPKALNEYQSSPSDDEDQKRNSQAAKVISNRMVRKLQEQIHREEILDLQLPEREPDTKRMMYRSMLKQAQIDPHLMNLFKRDRERNGEKKDDIDEDDEEIVDFDNFTNFVTRLQETHGKCGPNCIHLQRFFNKIGFYSQVQNRKVFEMKKTDIWEGNFERTRKRKRLPMIPRRKPKLVPSLPSINLT